MEETQKMIQSCPVKTQLPLFTPKACDTTRALVSIRSCVCRAWGEETGSWSCPKMLSCSEVVASSFRTRSGKEDAPTWGRSGLVPELCNSTESEPIRTYEQVCDVGLFLFNDVLVLTRRTVHHRPFTLAHRSTHTFLSSAPVRSLAVREVTHTRCEFRR